MKIAIDARWIFKELSGIGVYTQELIREFVRTETTDEFVLIFNDEHLRKRVAENTGYQSNPRFSDCMVPYGIFSLKNQWRLPKLLAQQNVDVFHSPNYMIPLRGMNNIKVIITIHDLIPMVLRDHAPKSKKSQFYPIFRQLMLRVAKQANKIIAVSEASKKDILTQLSVSEDKVKVIYNGVNKAFVPRECSSEKMTILTVGRLDPYKRVIDLVKAYEKLPAGWASLRIIASKDTRYPEVEKYIREKNVEVVWEQDIGFDELVEAYQQAAVFVLPSLYEGFGLPVVEAMAAGTPVICSNSSSLPEVAGSAALLFKATDVDALATQLEAILRDQSLAEDLRAKGLLQAQKFSWSKAAKETIACYKK